MPISPPPGPQIQVEDEFSDDVENGPANHVFNRVPEAYYDLERESKSVKVVRQVRAFEAQQKANIRQFMDTARQMLLEAGHIEPAIEIKIQERQKGVTRDIVALAERAPEH